MPETDKKTLPIVAKDDWLKPVEGEINYRHNLYMERLEQLESGAESLSSYANGYLYFGLHYDSRAKGWWFREWLPEAYSVHIMGDFNHWNREQLPLMKDQCGVWSILLSEKDFNLKHLSGYKIVVKGHNGERDRIPSYATYVVQDDESKDFCAVVWSPEHSFDWQGDSFNIRENPLLIYESHVGMAQEAEGVGSYKEFVENVLPRVKELGYTTIQLMAVAEHPYYGSFGYHVSNFFAPSSRFGTPDELKELVREAHKMGIGVIMDVVHSHYVTNINEGLNELDGSDHLYSPAGEAGDHPHWGSKLFDYQKHEVQHFLLSNLKYWIEEFHFDGFRFDGVTSMLYYHHGYTDFDSRDRYFDSSVNRSAITYLTLANRLIHTIKPEAITIAEDVSGMPGVCFSIEKGGMGFDYRLAMAIPDFWIKLLKDVPDEQWNIWQMWDMMTNRLADVGTIAYAESHDQALVGDKTLAFRLMDKEMYYHMSREHENVIIDRGLALHKMIRLFTITLGGGAYLNFMGNEFGHPEWIDFPREGNNWSYAYARRQWSLASNPLLKYSYFNDFDKAMIALVKDYDLLSRGFGWNLQMDEHNKTIVYSLGELLFVFNFHPKASIPDYRIPVPSAGRYAIVLDSDSKRFGGAARVDDSVISFSYNKQCEDGIERHYINIYNVSRTALVFKKLND